MASAEEENVDNPSMERWDQEYKSGKWNYLKNPLEKNRHAIIAMYINHFHPDGKVLDVGCGECILYDFLDSSQQDKFLGIDISSEAVKRAIKRRGANAIVGDAVNFETDETFDVIVFSEVIYYFNFRRILKRYANCINEDGMLIISAVRFRNMVWRIPWKILEWRINREAKKYFTEYQAIVINTISDGKKLSWKINIMKKSVHLKEAGETFEGVKNH